MRQGTRYHQPTSFLQAPHYHWPANQSINQFNRTVHHNTNTCAVNPQRRPFLPGTQARAMAQMTPAELEEFQNLSDRYQANLPGPLVGDKLPINVLVTEYSQADPTYVVKTTGLAATHSAYRAVKGDGQCGWRATVFSYFEILLNSGDPALVQQERIRFESYAETMRMIGIDYDLMVDMFDYTWEVFDRLLEAVQQNNRSDAVILDILNDENKSNSIVYHFKMVTSAFMKLREEDYQPFLEISVDEYRIARIDPTNQEIDQIGLQVLTNAVINPAGFGLEVLYLDRSMGEEVTPHEFAQGAPCIRLLYRPGHYDIIYRDTQPMQVFLQPQQNIPQHVEQSNYNDLAYSDATAALFGPSIGGYETTPPSYSTAGNYIQHQGQYEQYQQYFQPQTQSPHPRYAPQLMYAPPAQQASSSVMPSRASYSSTRSSMRNSASPRSATLSPPPTIETQAPSSFQIRYSARMQDMGSYSSVPISLSTTRYASKVLLGTRDL